MKTKDLQRLGDDAAAVLDNVRAIADSYAGAAMALGIGPDTVERAVVGAALRYSGCVSCRHSRASKDAVQYARKHGRLPLTMRGCALGKSQSTCSERESIFG